MFSLSPIPLESLPLRDGLMSPSAGAFCSFEGFVRNHNEGKSVTALAYEAHATLCAKQAEEIFREIRAQFPITSIKCCHRVGHLKVGDMAVWVGVTAPHRDAAFAACRYVIDEIKKRLPIWKKEFYRDGDSGWIGVSAGAVDRPATVQQSP